jgi:O-antigen/teichoic acid export membrane protein
MQNERDKLRSAYLVSITLVAAIGMPFAWGMAAAASQVVLTLLGSQWTAAIPVLAILSLAAPFTVLTHIGAVMCEATATLNVKLVIVACRLGWFVALLALLGPYGIVGIAIAFASSEFINHIAYLLVMRRMFKLDVADLWRAHSVGLGAGIITGAVVYALGLAMTAVGWLAPITLTVQVVAAALLLVGTITRARQGELWREIQCRLDQAGYRRESQGAAGWVIRRIDSLSPQKSAG